MVVLNNSGAELWKKAKKIIPGGNQLLSKRSEKFLPGLWPSYYSKAQGCQVWDIDGQPYYDFAGMGVASCTLGYADADVNNAVHNAISQGSMSSLNSFEEVQLAEKLIELHPWADMARFSRTGGEACSVAIRIARAAVGKSKIAFCGYHGWHDWYLSANLGDSSNLDGQLLPGLQPLGVPRELQKMTFPFNYNKLNELEEIIKEHGDEIGVIIMEPQRGVAPEKGFLEGVRKIADRIGAVLIFDEVTSGFRMNIGGVHLTFGVNPDIVILGKALGNGFPISAIVGRKEVMDCAQDSFISSTFWTERIGFVAALATIKKMEQINLPQYLIQYGELINDGWKKIAAENNIKIHVSGMPPLTHIGFQEEHPLELQTFYTQEMLEKGYLLGASLATTYAYSSDIINGFIAASNDVFAQMRKMIDSGKIQQCLKGEVVHAGFKRLTN